MSSTNALEEYYKALTDRELLNRARERGYTHESEQVLHAELARRKLAAREVKHFAAQIERNDLRDEVTERGGGYRDSGVQFFGRSYLNESDKNANIQVRTKSSTISGIPLIPIASYRFKGAGGSGERLRNQPRHEVIERVPLSWPQVCMTAIKTA